jgi:predicted MFS family arabinose efflux permease
MTDRTPPFHRMSSPGTARVDAGPRLAPLVVATAAAQALLFVLAPTLVDIARDLRMPVGAAAQARSVAALAAIAAAVVITPRIGRIGVPRLLAAGAATAVVACTTVALSRSINMFLAAHLLVGVAFAMLLSGGFAGVAAFTEGRRSRAMGFIAAANASAAITISPIAGLLTEHLSWRAAEIVPGVVSACALALSFRATPVTAKPGAPRVRAVLSNRSARTWVAAELSAYIAWTAFLTFNGAFFVESLGLGVASAGWLMAVGPVTYAVAATRSGGLAESFRRTRIVATAAVTMAVLLAILLVTTRTWPTAAALCALIGAAAGIRTPTSSTIGIAQLPDQPGAMMATRTATTQLGYLLGALVGGAVTAGAGYGGLGAVLGAGMVLSAILVIRVDEQPSATQASDQARSTSRRGRMRSPAATRSN